MILPFLPSPYDSVPKKDRLIPVICGDDVLFTVSAMLGSVPATPDNSIISASLADTVYSDTLWTGSWRCGIDESGSGNPGIAVVRIPHEVSDRLRQGTYAISVKVSDKLGNSVRTIASGSLSVEYSATSPHHSIPYRDDPNWPLTAQEAEDLAERLRYNVMQLEAGTGDATIVLPAGYILAASPALLPPNAGEPSIWLTDTEPSVTGVKVNFGTAIPSTGWNMGYVLMKVSE